jgi:integrase
METLKTLQSYKEELQDGLIMNAKTGRPLSPYTVRTRLYDISTLLGLDISGDLSDSKTAACIKRCLIEEGKDDSTISKLITTVKIAARHYDTRFSNPSLKYATVEKSVECLSRGQVDFIISNRAKIRNDQPTQAKKETVDYMIIGLIFGARLSDMLSWTMDNLQKREDGIWLVYKTQKTGSPIELPVPEMAMSTFNRQDHFLMPRTNSRLNERIRNIMFGYPELRPMAYAGHIHMFRSSCATYLLSVGAPEHYVKSVTGHTQDSRSFRRYVKVHKELKAEWKTAIAKEDDI